MKKSVKIMLVTLLVFCFLATLTVFAAEGKQLPETIRIGWAPSGMSGVFVMATDFFEKAIAEAEEYGFNIELTTKAMSSELEYEEQLKTIESFVQAEMDCIIVCPSSNMETIKRALDAATDKGIPIIMVNLLTKQEGFKIESYIGFDNVVGGAVSGYAMVDYLGGPGVLGKGERVDVPVDEYLDLAKWEEIYADFDWSSITAKVAILEGIAGGFYSDARLKGFRSVIDKCENVEVVAQIPADWDRQKAVRAAENILQSNPELDAMVAFNTEMAMGALTATENMNRTEVKIFSNDGTEESLASIKNGGLMAETWHGFPSWGWYGTEFAVKLVLGQEVPETFDTKPRTEYAANVDSFYPNAKLRPIDWQAIKDEYLKN
jgi:ribose transport system substrate-binding protein